MSEQEAVERMWQYRDRMVKAEAQLARCREALRDALPWIGVEENRRGHWCPPEIKERVAALAESDIPPPQKVTGWPPEHWYHAKHGLHDEAHHQAHSALDICVPLNTATPPAESDIRGEET